MLFKKKNSAKLKKNLAKRKFVFLLEKVVDNNARWLSNEEIFVSDHFSGWGTGSL